MYIVREIEICYILVGISLFYYFRDENVDLWLLCMLFLLYNILYLIYLGG